MSDAITISATAKELAEANGIDLKTIQGTGANGAIVKADVEALVAPAPAAPAAPEAAGLSAAAPAPAAPAVEPAPAVENAANAQAAKAEHVAASLAVESEPVQDIKVAEVKVEVQKTLPLVVEAPEGGWANEAQEAYAKTLNGYAYANPAKWNAKKDELIDRLRQLKDNPALLGRYTGNTVEGVEGSVTFKNQDAPINVLQD